MHTSADIPEVEPTQILAGSTVKWTRDLSDHYAADDGWSLNYNFVGKTPLVIAATADGSEFAVTLSATDSNTLIPGWYTLYGRVSKAGEVFDVFKGNVEVLDNPDSIPAERDQRSWARITRDNLRLAVQGSSDSFILNYSVAGAGRTIGKMTAEDRIKWLQHFEALVLAEEQAAGLKGRKILVRFTQP